MSISVNQQKFIASLSVKKYRHEHRKFVVEGEKMVNELLRQQRIRVQAVYGLENWVTENTGIFSKYSGVVHSVTEAELKKISSLTTPNSVLAVADLPADDEPLPDVTSIVLYLDGIQDPGNLGTILRTADWFGIHTVYCSPDCADAFASKTIQAGMGAFLRVFTREIALENLLQQVPFQKIWGAVLNGQSVTDVQFAAGDLLVIGSEGRGIRPEVEHLLTHRITIPRHPAGGAESLNAAVAAGILMSRV
jgi:RNA methyltransferase, TrmH family